MDQNTSIREIKGVGDKAQKLFEKIQIYTVSDLLHHYPREYDDFKQPVDIASVSPGDCVAILAKVQGNYNLKTFRHLNVGTCFVKDHTGAVQLTFFNMPYLRNVLKNGATFVFRGTIQSRGTALVMEQPKMYSLEEYKKLTGVLQPKYGLTKGLTNNAIQKAVKQCLSFYPFEKEYYPSEILEQYGLVSGKEALEQLHFPENRDAMLKARKRVVFDEFFSFLLLMKKNKELCKGLANNYVMMETADTVRFLEALPFKLTKGQKKVWQDIRNDFSGEYCMNRLVQGDVGSGKTIVAVLALIMCAANGYQGAMMAPTEVLAKQHFENICEYTEKYNLPLHPVLLVGSMTAKEKKENYRLMEEGIANVIIGTSALIQEKANYKSLALVITDEQHRFGVKQREQLAEKGLQPHVLVMSATPIPRTLAIILYGDLQLSVIDELPANRLPIKNCVVNTAFRPKAYAFIEKEVRASHQAYVICPQVEEGDSSDLENVVDYTEKLRNALPADIQIAYLHGKMKPAEKNRIMDEFSKGNIHVLVSTTVIEVGINVPNSTVMMVENAERFGLAQLHQLRGRVGRGDAQSYCIFISSNETKDTMKRLDILNRSNDGFFIASEDLKLRGPGDFFGVRQSGDFAFRLGDIYTDAAILQDASNAVEELLTNDPHLLLEENQLLVKHFEENAMDTVDFRTI